MAIRAAEIAARQKTVQATLFGKSSRVTFCRPPIMLSPPVYESCIISIHDVAVKVNEKIYI